VGEVIQLRPRLSRHGRNEPASIRDVVQACLTHLDANASLDDLTAKVRSLVGPNVYEVWAAQAFQAVVAAITAEPSDDESIAARSSCPSDAAGTSRRVSLVN
jgi:hypothetical protein